LIPSNSNSSRYRLEFKHSSTKASQKVKLGNCSTRIFLMRRMWFMSP